MLIGRCGGIRKNGKHGLAAFRNCKRALDFGAMLRAADFSEICREADVHNSFFPANQLVSRFPMYSSRSA